MQLLEHDAKQVLTRYGISVPAGRVACSAEEAAAAGSELGFPVAVKAQLPAGGRGKAGAIRRAEDVEGTRRAFEAILDVEIDGLHPRSALLEPWLPVQREFYLAAAVDSTCEGPVLLFSASGGMDVEQATGRIARVPLDADGYLPGHLLRREASRFGVEPAVIERVIGWARTLCRVLVQEDAWVAEINPLGVMDGGKLIALDAKLVVDEYALPRHPATKRLIDAMEPKPEEYVIRRDTGLVYIRLGGSVGLLSGGAGMTMAVMDLIRDMGGEPACFLDCSANPTRDGYRTAFDLLEHDPRVQSILVSVFGGGTQMDRVARILSTILTEHPPSKPVHLRIEGTYSDRGRATLREAGLHSYMTIEEAVAAAVADAGEGQ